MTKKTGKRSVKPSRRQRPGVLVDPPDTCVEHAEHRDDFFTFGIPPFHARETGVCLNFSYNHIYLLSNNTIRLRTAGKTIKHRVSPQEFKAIGKLVQYCTDLSAKKSVGEQDKGMAAYFKRNPIRCSS